MDATDKVVERLLEWFRNKAREGRLRVYDDNDGVSIGIDGHIKVCELVAFLLHGNATHTPGPPPEQVGVEMPQRELVQAALQNLPDGFANSRTDQTLQMDTKNPQ
jgi:hypothetical protein